MSLIRPSLFTSVLGGGSSQDNIGLLTTNACGQTAFLNPDGSTYTYKGAGVSLLDVSTISTTQLVAQTGSFQQLASTGPITAFGVGSLLMRAFDITADINSNTWANNPVGGRLFASQLVTSISYANLGGVPIAGITSNYFVRFTGYLCSNTTDTYTFQVTVDDGARIYLNNQKIVDSWKAQSPSSYVSNGVPLTAGNWVPFVAEWFQGGGGSCFQIQFKNTTNVTAYTPLSHSVVAGQIQLAYDSFECAPSQLGTTFVNGDLLVGGALNLPSTSTPINPLASSVTLYNDSGDNMTKVVQSSGALQVLSFGSEFSTYSNATSQTASSSYSKYYSVTTNSLLGGTYRIEVSYTIKGITSVTSAGIVYFTVDNVVVHLNSPICILNGSNFVCVDLLTLALTAGTHTLACYVKAVTGTITILSCTASIFRVV